MEGMLIPKRLGFVQRAKTNSAIVPDDQSDLSELLTERLKSL